MSRVLQREVALVVLDVVGFEKGEKLMDRLVNMAIIDRIQNEPKQFIFGVRNEFLLEQINRKQSEVTGE